MYLNEHINGHRRDRNRPMLKHYLLPWQQSAHQTWEGNRNLKKKKKTIEEYKRKNIKKNSFSFHQKTEGQCFCLLDLSQLYCCCSKVGRCLATGWPRCWCFSFCLYTQAGKQHSALFWARSEWSITVLAPCIKKHNSWGCYIWCQSFFYVRGAFVPKKTKKTGNAKKNENTYPWILEKESSGHKFQLVLQFSDLGAVNCQAHQQLMSAW